MIVFSDLHLREQTADVCFRVLDRVWELSGRGLLPIIFLGDFWHLRYAVNVALLNRVNELFSSWVDSYLIAHSRLPSIHLLPGNHDQVSPDGRNALEVLAREGVKVWTEPGVDAVGVGEYIGFVPYRKDSEQQGADLGMIASNLSAEGGIVFGHFGVLGAKMNAAGKRDTDGLEPALPGNVKLILGHYHTQQSGPGWQYVGSPYQISFGEAGNRCGVLIREAEGTWSFQELREGPRHHILKWDPAQSDDPPPMPQDWQTGDKVRLDVVASREMIVGGKLQGQLKRAGLEDVSVCVVPTAVEREHRFDRKDGETLLGAAERFARERLDPKAGQPATDAIEAKRSDELMVPGPHNPDAEQAMAALRRWAQ